MEKIISIDSKNPDYYAWGKNCAFLGFDETTTEKCLEIEPGIESRNFDLFWLGYFENVIGNRGE